MAYSRNFNLEASEEAAANYASGNLNAATIVDCLSLIGYGSTNGLKVDSDSTAIGHNWQYDSATELASGDGTYTVKVKPNVVNDAASTRCGIFFRGNAGGTTGYAFILRPINSFRLSRFSGGTETAITTVTPSTSPYVASTWYNIKVFTSGSTIKGKIWKDGDSEPGTWDIDTTDATHNNTNLKIGWYFFENTTSANRFAYFDDFLEESSSVKTVTGVGTITGVNTITL